MQYELSQRQNKSPITDVIATLSKARGLPTLSVSGTYGAGKTSFIDRLTNRLGPNTFYIFNDGMRAAIDPARIRLDREAQNGSEIRSFATGCACCQTYPQIMKVLQDIIEARKNGSQIERVVIELPGNADNSKFRQRLSRNEGIDVTGVSLINVKNFDRDQVLGLVDRHVGHSAMVMLTWADGLELTDPKLKNVLEYIFVEQKLSVPVAILKEEGIAAVITPEQITSIIGKSPEYLHRGMQETTCIEHNHEHDHTHGVNEHAHDHEHEHDHSHHADKHLHDHHSHQHNTQERSFEVELKPDTTVDHALRLLDPYFDEESILRVKGIMQDDQTKELVYVSGTRDDIKIRPLTDREARLGTFITVVSLRPIPEAIFSEHSVPLSSVSKGSFMKYNPEVRVGAVNSLLADLQAARQERLLHKDEANQLVVLYDVFENLEEFTSTDDMPQELRKKAINELLEVRLAAGVDLQAKNYADPNNRIAWWKETLGGHIAYYIIYEPEIVENELADKLKSLKPATMYFEGLANREKGEPTQEETSPLQLETLEWFSSLIRYGQEEGLTKQTVVEAFARCKERDTSGQWELGFENLHKVIEEEFSND